jgi:hypothetical protein
MQRPPIIVLVSGALLAAIALVAVLTPPGGASVLHAQSQRAAAVSPEEAEAWAEARAADTPAAYRVYLAAFPSGAFAEDAHQALDPTPPARQIAQTHDATLAPRGPSAAEIASSCRAHVDATLPPPSRVARIGGGAAGGCAVGLLAGGDDGRNCAIGAVAGGAGGALTVQGRERRRREEVQACIANGGP